ncbi:hypothetical protein DI392_08365 [Vibrio albus]|uniref:RapA2 cadherin-like domain-containing protein n=1 Tax=Vibrio albus TaxID=2200953 RepID=A0A2U3BBM4_9VIBR|nr:hypothetical protein DI392_08365 [Vibrio albus]
MQYLGDGDTKQEVFTVATEDGTEHDITITITGVNDGAVVSGDDSGAVTEDASDPTLTDSGILTVTDADEGEAVFVPASVSASAGALGSLTIDAAGNWVYNVANSDVQYLGDGDTKQEVFTVETAEGTEHDITITITGVNDGAVVSGDDSGAVTEDASDPTLTDSGILTVTDADEGEAVFVPASVSASAGALGSLTIDAAGNWVYNVANSDVQYLGDGDTKQEVFTVATEDGTEHDITITITGVNDGAVVSGDDSGAVTEDASDPTLTDSGILTVTDADEGEAVFVPASVSASAGALGSLTIDAAGNWVYNVANSDVQYLGDGDTKQEVFTVATEDGTEHDITITITGVNDGAVVSGDDSGAVTEDASDPTLTDSGILTVTDADEGEAVFVPASVSASAGALGSLTIDAAGNWVYNVANSDVQYLGDGDTKQEVFTVETAEGTEHDITITITGVNDGAVVSGDDSGAVTEDASDPTLTDSGILTVTDADEGEAVFVPASVSASAGALGSLTIDAAGNWVYNVANSDVQYLGDGDTKQEVFTVETAEGTEHDITITITGVNDGAVVSGDDSGAVTEDASDPTLTDSGILTVTDADEGEAVFVPGSVVASVGALGSLTIDAAGNWVYNVANSDVQYLGDGDTKQEVFTVETAEGTEHDITITITGVNDLPVVSSNTITVFEDSDDTNLGLTAPTDVDDSVLTIEVTGLPTLGTVTYANGDPVQSGDILTEEQLLGLEYDAPYDYDPVADGDVGDFTYSVSDGTGTVSGSVDITVVPFDIQATGDVRDIIQIDTTDPDNPVLAWKTIPGSADTEQDIPYDADGANINTYGGGDFVSTGAGDDTIFLGDASKANKTEGDEQALINDIEKFIDATDAEMQYMDTTSDSKVVDEYTNNAFTDVAFSGDGEDTVYGQGGVDLIYGGLGNDSLYGGDATDVLRGGPGDDYLDGGAGNDYLIGGEGNDILVGGEGIDTFIWKAEDLDGSTDTIKDFSIADGDKIDLSDILSDMSDTEVDSYLNSLSVTESANGLDSELIIEHGGESVTIVFEGYADDMTTQLTDYLLQNNGIVTD